MAYLPLVCGSPVNGQSPCSKGLRLNTYCPLPSGPKVGTEEFSSPWARHTEDPHPSLENSSEGTPSFSPKVTLDWKLERPMFLS